MMLQWPLSSMPCHATSTVSPSSFSIIINFVCPFCVARHGCSVAYVLSLASYSLVCRPRLVSVSILPYRRASFLLDNAFLLDTLLTPNPNSCVFSDTWKTL
jgi:hypothetical protein